MAKAKAVGYVRVSTTEQVDGFGLEVQRSAIKRYATEKDLRLVRTFSDEGLSGSNGLDARVGLAGAREMALNGEVKAVIIYRLDRLARDLGLQEMFMADMRRAGVEVLSVTEPDIDSEDGTRVLMRQMLGAIAQYERWTIRTRMVAGKAAKVAGGGYGGGRPPFGWRADGKGGLPDDREQEVIAFMRQLAREGLSSREIAARLEQAGHRPKVGEHWSSVQVLRVLKRG